MTLPTNPVVYIDTSYYKSGKIKSITAANGVNGGGTTTATYTESYAYEYGHGSASDDQLSSTTVNGATTPTYEYAYDADRLTHVNGPGTNWDYTYDDDSNLTKVITNPGGTVYYGYNGNDSLCWSGPNANTSAAMSQNCAATPSGNTGYTSDKNGNNLGTTSAPITYNAQNQATQIAPLVRGAAVTQTYYDQGNNLRYTSGSDTFTVGSKLGVTARRNSSGVTYYTRDPYGQVVNSHGAGGTLFNLNDRLGSTMALINTSGTKAGGYTYDPFGKPTIVNGTSATAATNNPFRFTGGYQDSTGYYHLAARYYDTASRFTQADPIAGDITRPEQYNSYTYTGGQPCNKTDLTGNSAGECFGAFLGFAAALSSLYGNFPRFVVIGLSGGVFVASKALYTACPVRLYTPPQCRAIDDPIYNSLHRAEVI